MLISRLFFVPLYHEKEGTDSRRNGNEISLSERPGHRVEGGETYV